MTVSVRNTTLSAIPLEEVGNVVIGAGNTYTIPPQDYFLWAASTEYDSFLDSGDLVASNGVEDLTAEKAKLLLHFNSGALAHNFHIVETVPASDTLVVDAVPFATFRGMKILFSVSNSSQNLYETRELLVSRSASSVKSQVYGRLGDSISLSSTVAVSGSEVQLTIVNSEAFALTVAMQRTLL